MSPDAWWLPIAAIWLAVAVCDVAVRWLTWTDHTERRLDHRRDA